MSRIHRVDPGRPGEALRAVQEAARAIREGGLVVLPTETVYGIAGRPDDPGATGAIFEAKQRPRGLSLPVLAPTAEIAWTIGRPTDRARSLAGAHWPGALTLVLHRTESSRLWELGEERETVAVRVPDHPIAASLIERAGPIAATSANISGRPPLDDPNALVDAFGDAVDVYLVLVGTARRPAGVASTIVDVTGPTPWLVRTGAIDVSADVVAGGPNRAR